MSAQANPQSPDGSTQALQGKVAVVTGAGAGIGSGIARSLARSGASVVLFDSDPETTSATAAQIQANGWPAATQVIGDVRVAGDVENLVSRAQSLAGGQIDILVNNVGDHRPWGPFAETVAPDWMAVYQLNLEHVFRLTHAFLPGMIAQGSGSIVNVSSVEGLRGVPNCAVYGACKAGVLNFTASLATEVGQHGVRVNAIAPDLTDTPQFPLSEMVDRKYADQIPKWVPVGRFGTPDDHGDVVAFLASDQARFITGQTIKTDGGTMASAGWFRRDDRLFTNIPRGLR